MAIRKSVLGLLCFLVVGNLCAQREGMTKYEWGLNLGFTNYQGDLSGEALGSLKTQKLLLDIYATRLLGPYFSVKANLLISKLKGDDALFSTPDYKRHRAFNFTSPLYELSARFQWMPSGRNYSEFGLAPYVFAGAGIAFLDIKRDWSKTDRDYFVPPSDMLAGLAIDSVQATPESIPVIPVGGGLRYIISRSFALNAEMGYRITTNDYIDGFSKAANPELKDSYFTYAIGIVIHPAKKDQMSCPQPRY
jgi:hypothetical protein